MVENGKPTLEEFKKKCSVRLYGKYSKNDEEEEGVSGYKEFSVTDESIKLLYEQLDYNNILELVYNGVKVKYNLYENLAVFVNYSSEKEMQQDLME